MAALLVTVRRQAQRFALRVYAVLPAPVRRLVVRSISPKYMLGVLAVVRDGDDVLLLRQRHDPTDWSLPGGLLKRGEAPYDALVRELAEELGIQLPVPAQPTHIHVVADLRRADLIHEVRVSRRPQVHVDDIEVLEVAWLPIDGPVRNEVTAAVLALVRASG